MQRCEACLQLEVDGRRRTPHDGLRMVNSQPVERVLESGVRARTLQFVCRHCDTHWTLCDADQSLFVHWIAARPAGSLPAELSAAVALPAIRPAA
ncbi:hypothetical protein MW7_003300 [Imbroritus primus]|jgi:hypothetical protein|uniref:Uncharacterized protein n=1 Tax=Imbroritus primus TaxID=3058603 RepID=A0ACD3SSF3_9BURK|nr:hypothetical protein MW7_003300 [Burkholderiaceae bacterium PBA]